MDFPPRGVDDIRKIHSFRLFANPGRWNGRRGVSLVTSSDGAIPCEGID